MIGRFGAVLASPQAVLTYAIACWGFNSVVGRYANLDVPPVALSFWRHLLATAMLLPFVVPALRRDAATIRARWRPFAVLALLVVLGNTLIYFAVLETTVVNLSLINAGVPVFSAALSWPILRELVNRWQTAGIAISFVGIAIVATRGDVAALAALDFAAGDALMVAAVAAWGLYGVLFKRAGLAVSPWTLLFALTFGGAIFLAPAYAVEIAAGRTMTWTPLGAASLVYVALFTTIAGWACWNSGLARIGPNRASAFMCLHPLFGAAFGIAFFDETLAAYHLLGTALTLAGVILVSRDYVRNTSRIA